MYQTKMHTVHCNNYRNKGLVKYSSTYLVCQCQHHPLPTMQACHIEAWLQTLCPDPAPSPDLEPFHILWHVVLL